MKYIQYAVGIIILAIVLFRIDLQETLQTIGYLGHRHHTSVTGALVAEPVTEAFEKYLGYEVVNV